MQDSSDLDKLAEVFASCSSEIVGTYRFVIQPNNVLREFRTVWHGFLFTIRRAARMCVNGLSTNYIQEPFFMRRQTC